MGSTHGKTEVYGIYLPTWRKEVICETCARFSALKMRFKTTSVSLDFETTKMAVLVQ
jgi:hypothetical protein